MVAASILPAKLTYDEFQTLPDDGRRYELIDGELQMFAGPSISHQVLSIWLSTIFFNAVIAQHRGWVLTAPVEVKFPGENAVQPDLVVVLNDRASIIDGKRIVGPPSLVVEILSMSTQVYDRSTKARLYAEHGVPEYWIVDMFNETVVVHALREGSYVAVPTRDLAISQIIPDLSVEVRPLFDAARNVPNRD